MLLNNEVSPAQAILKSLQNSGGDDIIRYRAEQLLDQIRNQQEVEKDLREYQERGRQVQEEATRSVETKLKDEPPRLTRSNTAVSRAPEDAVVAKSQAQTPIPEGTRVEGSLIQVECSGGLTLRLRVRDTTVELHTDVPAQVEFVSYVSTVKETFSCGAINPEIPVAIVYKRTEDHRFLGEPIRVEFVERN